MLPQSRLLACACCLPCPLRLAGAQFSALACAFAYVNQTSQDFISPLRLISTVNRGPHSDCNKHSFNNKTQQKSDPRFREPLVFISQLWVLPSTLNLFTFNLLSIQKSVLRLIWLPGQIWLHRPCWFSFRKLRYNSCKVCPKGCSGGTIWYRQK